MAESNSVFISYRRSVSGFLALAVYQELRENGIDSFYDIESIDTGQFDIIILNQIAARPYFLPILTPGTLDRCLEPGDMLLREIKQALKLKRVIVPLYTPEFQFSDMDKFLPSTVAGELKRYNAVEIPHRYFKYAMQDVRTRFLKPTMLQTSPAPKTDEPAVARKLDKAAAEPPVTDRQLTAQEHFEQGFAHNSMGEYDTAIADYTEAIRLDPQDALAYYNRGSAYDSMGEYDKAIADYIEAIRLDPQYALAYYNRGSAYDSMGEYDKAIADYTEAIHLDPQNADAYVNRGSAYDSMGEYDKAIADYTEAIRLDSKDALAYSNRGEAYFAQRQYPLALIDFQKAGQFESDLKFVMPGLAITNCALGQLKAARRLWLSLVEKDERYRDADWVGEELNWAAPLVEEARKLISAL